ncbi:MAG: DUF2189 domain-containing protein [Betaproteobacteria bacterium]|nr:DUF2189 domain-containing protein [Betaproteobacteria bacterium]
MPQAPADSAAADSHHALAVAEVGWSRPLAWLARGWADFMRSPGPGLAHGAVCALFGLALVALARERFWILVGACTGFLLVAPVVATGLYATSRALDQGRRASLADAVAVWRSFDGRLVRFGLLLALAGTGWVLTSAALITGFAAAPILGPADFVREVVLNPRSWLFEAWLLLGAVLAAPVFASSVVAMPLLLDRPVGVLTAVLTSWRAVLGSPAAMALWAFVLALLCGIGMGTAMLGLVVVVPWLGHASWHAYRDIVGAAGGTAPRSG